MDWTHHTETTIQAPHGTPCPGKREREGEFTIRTVPEIVFCFVREKERPKASAK